MPTINVTAARFAPGEEPIALLTGHRDGVVRLWLLDTLTKEFALTWESQAHRDTVTCLDVTDSFVVSGSEDRSVAVIATDSGHVQHVLRRTARCDGMIIDGVEGPQEFELLAKLLERASDAV